MAVHQTTDLHGLLAGRSEEEITSEVERQGIDAVLDRVFDLIAAAFLPDASAVESAIVQFDVTAPDGVHSYQLKFADDQCVVRKAHGEAARLTVSLAMLDFLRIIAGELDGMQAFSSRRLRLSGDVLLAQAMRGWFRG
jgi:putative sterol carrier protein